ncbi:hypothetical protein EJD97_017590, partial [Solanum chilense]
MPDVVRLSVLPKGDDTIATPNVVRPCVQFKGDDNMPCLTSFDRGATPDVLRPCVLAKGNVVMPSLTKSYCVCCPRVMMAYHARHRPTLCAIQGPRWHVTTDIVRPRVLPYGDDGMPRQMSYDRVCFTRAMIAS